MRRVEKALYHSRQFTSHPSFYTMKIVGRPGFTRPVIARLSNRQLESPQTRLASIFEDLDAESAVCDLQKDGLSLGRHLPLPLVDEIRRDAEETYCYGNAQPEFGFPYRRKAEAENIAGQRFVVGTYFNTSRHCSAIRDLEHDPQLWRITAGYFGTMPSHIGNQLWWSHTGERTQGEQNCHTQLY